MHRRIKHLVDRLSMPHVALRLRKEEVCLSIGALGKVGGPYSQGVDAEDVVPVEALMLKQRMLQFIPSCSGLELGLVASGSMSMRWIDGSLADQLMSRAMALPPPSAASSSAPFTLELAGPLLLSTSSITWRERSLASERCATFLARQALSAGKQQAVGDADSFASGVLGTILLMLSARSECATDHSLLLTSEELRLLVDILSANCRKLSDVGGGLAVASCIVLLSEFPDMSSALCPAFIGFAQHVDSINQSNPLSVAPSVLALAATHHFPSESEKVSVISKQLIDSLLQRVEEHKNDEILTSLLYAARMLKHPNSLTEDNVLDSFIANCRDECGLGSIPPLGMAIARACARLIDKSDPLTLAVFDHFGELGRLGSSASLTDAIDATFQSSPSIFSLRDAAMLLLMIPTSEISEEQLQAGLRAARLSHIRDPVVLQSLQSHIQSVLDGAERPFAKAVLNVLGSDPAVFSSMGISEAIRSGLLALAADEQASDVLNLTLPMQFKALRARGEAVSDTLLMSVLEAIDEWTAGDIAYFVAAAPDKCVEFDMLVEKLSEGLQELSTEQLACVLSAVAESPALSLSLHDAAFAQAADFVERVGLDAPPLIASLITLFVKTYSKEYVSDSATLQQREELRNLIDKASGQALTRLASADIFLTCSLLRSFEKCPSLGATVIEVCCGHLVSLVSKGCTFDDLIAILDSMAVVDSVHSELIDTIVPLLERFLKSNADATIRTRLVEVCVALDTPELDTLFQLSFSSLVGSNLDELEPSQLASVLSGALALEHRPGAAKLVHKMTTSCEALKRNADSFNKVVCALGSDSGDSTRLERLLCAEHETTCISSEDLGFMCRQLLESASSLIEHEFGNRLGLAQLFTAVRRLTIVSDFLAASKKIEPNLRPGIPTTVIDCIVDRIDSIEGPEVATIICGLPYFDLDRNDTSALLQILVTRLSHESDKCCPNLLSDAIFSLGELDNRIGLHITHHVAVDKMSDYCVDNVSRWASGRSICRLLYGFSRIACNKRSLFNVFGTQLGKRPLLMLLSREDVSLAMSAFGNAKYLDKELYDALAEHMVVIADDLTPADLTLVLTGYSRMNLLNQSLYDTLGNRVAQIADEMPTGAAARLLCAYGHVGNGHDTMAEKLLTSISTNTSLLSANECTNTLYGIAQMEYAADSDHLDALARRIADDRESLTCSSIAKLCEVSQHLNWRNEDLLVAIADRSVQIQQEVDSGNNSLKPETSRAVLDTLGFFMVHHKNARLHLTDSARTVSRDPSVMAELFAAGGGAPARLEE